ncbi:hypothetical protein AALA99_05765 [Anaerotruncus colihominis]|jgi:hypothetical protein|uniref:Polyketide cyclase n=1 Tax=Anaerotruncus colihominis TaxID=169435 RepID=A0A845RKL2_9FIRM|nr:MULTISPECIES: hypothetical protein [Anaerotruncus]MCI8493419.1 hypothetical protein [Anaerotruncus sp.]NBI78252.1 hypothetical protein [Anaerotruncus colihominis]
MKKFEAQVSLMTGKSDKEIWDIWTDIANWTKWDDSTKVEIDGAFQVGSTIRCHTEGDDEPRCMTIVSVKENEEFTDQTVLPFGKITTSHIIKSFEGNIQVTHKIVAEMNDDMAAMFGTEIFPHIQSGIFEALNRLINL